MKQPLVSVIVPTLNSEEFLDVCLKSIVEQTYQNIELIVVDNHSTDETINIARKYTQSVYVQGPERSAQVNFGATKARGDFVYKVDSDFVLDKEVIQQCVTKVLDGYDAVIVHNSPAVHISWIAKIRRFEVDMYKYDMTHSSARFVNKQVYHQIAGFDEKITAGEDYDFQNKLNRGGFKTAFIDAEALHLGEPTNFWKHMTKYYQYGKDFVNYRSANKNESKAQLSPLRSIYAKNWRKFLMHPLKSLAFTAYSLTKFLFGGAGFLHANFITRSTKQAGSD